jgi:hypothetical protein
MVHFNVVEDPPVLDSPVTPEVGEEVVVTVPDPEVIDHAPVPTDGVFPLSVVDVPQIV